MAKKQEIPMPFYAGDWLRCPELRVLPPDVRGLWMDMLCYMWESVERGVMVMPNGQPCTKEDVVRIIGTDSSGSTGWLDVLIDNKVCEVREDGAIYSRRMVKDNLISEKRRLAGKKGGETTKAKVFIPKTEVPPDPPQQPEATDPPPLSPEQQEKVEKAKKYKYADYVTLTRDEYAKLCVEFTEDAAKEMIDMLNNYKGSKGRKYKSDYLTIRGWVKDKYYENMNRYGQQTGTTAATDIGKPSAKRTFRDTL